VSLELARHRAATLSGVRYALALDVTARDSATGRVEARFRRAPGAGDLVMDFRGPGVREVRANGAAVEDVEWRDGHLRIPARHLRDGENVVSAAFTSRIAAAGAPIIRADDATDGATYLYTLLVPNDAAGALPLLRPAGPQGPRPRRRHRAGGVDGGGERGAGGARRGERGASRRRSPSPPT
jgi:aminopeptidase N